jgi:hypothetical protein
MKTEYTLSDQQAFDAMYAFLEKFLFEETNNAYVGLLLPELSMLSEEHPGLMKPSRWDDWQKCIQAAKAGKVQRYIEAPRRKGASRGASKGRRPNIPRELKWMESRCAKRDWSAIESRYLDLHGVFSTTLATAIQQIDLSKYITQISHHLNIAATCARSVAMQAVYFEYDMDNDWRSAFYLCPGPTQDPDWSCKWVAMVPSAPLDPFAEVLSQSDGFCETPEASALSLHLIARTICALGRAAQTVDLTGLSLSMGYHDQDPITNVQ